MKLKQNLFVLAAGMLVLFASCSGSNETASASSSAGYLTGSHEFTFEVTSPGIAKATVKLYDNPVGDPWMTLGGVNGVTLPYSDSQIYTDLAGTGRFLKYQAVVTVTSSQTLTIILKVDGVEVRRMTQTSSSDLDVSVSGTF